MADRTIEERLERLERLETLERFALEHLKLHDTVDHRVHAAMREIRNLKKAQEGMMQANVNGEFLKVLREHVVGVKKGKRTYYAITNGYLLNADEYELEFQDGVAVICMVDEERFRQVAERSRAGVVTVVEVGGDGEVSTVWQSGTDRIACCEFRG